MKVDRARLLGPAAVAMMAALLVGACSSAATQAPPTAAPTTAATAEPTSPPTEVPSAEATASPAATESEGPAETPPESSGDYTIAVATDATVGKYLTGENGLTLYTFKPDSANTSTCSDNCAVAWPPFTLEGDEKAVAGDGVTGQIGSFSRADGKTQVIYKGLPLYYFQGDAKAGDLNGQGLGGNWFAATP